MSNIEEGAEIVLMAIPLFHVYGMVAGMLFAVAGGASMVMVPNPRDFKDVLHSIDKNRPTVFPRVSALYNAINNQPDGSARKYDFRSIKSCISSSGPPFTEAEGK